MGRAVINTKKPSGNVVSSRKSYATKKFVRKADGSLTSRGKRTATSTTTGRTLKGKVMAGRKITKGRIAGN